MKLVPSTPGEVSIFLRRRFAGVIVGKHFAKYSSVKEEVNTLLKEHDTPANHVTQVTITYTFPVERK